MNNQDITLEDFFEDVKKAYNWQDLDATNEEIIYDVFYSITNTEENKPNNEFPYEFIEDFEQRGDGSGYETYYIFKRKADGKFFAYYIYDGNIEEYKLREVTRKMTYKWDFECTY